MQVLPAVGRTPLGGVTPAQINERASVKASAAATVELKPATTGDKSGQVVSRLNGELEEQCKSTQASDIPCKIRVMSKELPTPFRYMTETIEHKLSCLRWRLQDWQRALELHLPNGANCMPINVITQDDVYIVGHVVCDAESGRLNSASTMLEGLTADRGAGRVHLDLSQVPVFQLFPGQVVGAKGFSLTGTKFIVRELYTHLPKPLPAVPTLAPLQDTPTRWSMVIASGPFTSVENQDYQPLKDLLDYCHRTRPSAVLLLGPLVDERHPQLEMLDITVQQLAEAVEKQLGDWADSHPECQLVLMSSTRDVHHHPVFPTPPYSLKQGLANKAVPLPNPCVFKCNDVVMGACSTDVLLNLSAEVAQWGPHPDRLGSIASNLLGQHRFYPLFPPALGTCLDTSFHTHLEMRLSPNVLILPSELSAFAKAVPVKQTLPSLSEAKAPGTTICINPGRLTKGKNAGTFAHVTVLPSSTSEGAAVKAVHERCMVQIISV